MAELILVEILTIVVWDDPTINVVRPTPLLAFGVRPHRADVPVIDSRVGDHVLRSRVGLLLGHRGSLGEPQVRRHDEDVGSVQLRGLGRQRFVEPRLVGGIGRRVGHADHPVRNLRPTRGRHVIECLVVPAVVPVVVESQAVHTGIDVGDDRVPGRGLALRRCASHRGQVLRLHGTAQSRQLIVGQPRVHRNPGARNREVGACGQADGLVEVAYRRVHHRRVRHRRLCLRALRRAEIGGLVQDDTLVVQDGHARRGHALHELRERFVASQVVRKGAGHRRVPVDRLQAIGDRRQAPIHVVPRPREVAVELVRHVVHDCRTRDPAVEHHARVGPWRRMLERLIAQEHVRTRVRMRPSEPRVVRTRNQRLDVARGLQGPAGVRRIGVRHVQVSATRRSEEQR